MFESSGLTLIGPSVVFHNLPSGYNDYIYRDVVAGIVPGNYTITLYGGNDELVDVAVVEVA